MGTANTSVHFALLNVYKYVSGEIEKFQMRSGGKILPWNLSLWHELLQSATIQHMPALNWAEDYEQYLKISLKYIQVRIVIFHNVV